MINILKELNQRPIAYYPVYRKITGSTTAGILLSQLMYWFRNKDKIYKVDKELREETLLTEGELKNAKSILKRLPFLTISREGMPAKTFYQIDWDKFIEYLQENYSDETENLCDIEENTQEDFEDFEDFEEDLGGFQTSLAESSKQDWKNHPNKMGRIIQTNKNNNIYIQRLQQKTTTENKKKYIKKSFSFSLGKNQTYENLSDNYKKKLKAYAVTKDGAYSFENFVDFHESKGSKFKNWSKAYNTWLRNIFEKGWGKTILPTRVKCDGKDAYLSFDEKFVVVDDGEFELLDTKELKASAKKTEQPQTSCEKKDINHLLEKLLKK